MRHQPYFDGPPRFDVGLKPIALDHWLLPDDQAAWLGPKNELIDRQPSAIFADMSESYPAQQEVADLIARECATALRAGKAPLMAASRLVSDDLVVMEMVDGAWTNTACCLCSPTFFSAEHARGKSLYSLHDPVPDGGFGLAARIGRVFTNLQPDTILERHNWTVQWSDARFTPDGSPLREAAAKADLDQASANLFLRVERQTIRRLPKTGAILFTIRIRLSHLAHLLTDKSHAIAFRDAWISAPEPVRHYKKWAVLERHVATLLAKLTSDSPSAR
jgi:dimethylamine monooxygenase subunit A